MVSRGPVGNQRFGRLPTRRRLPAFPTRSATGYDRRMRFALPAAALAVFAAAVYSQSNRPADPHGQTTFFVHRISDDHAEGITTPRHERRRPSDLVSGAYWYENPGPNGGEWKRHQYRAPSASSASSSPTAASGRWT